MAFVQIVEFATDRFGEVEELMEEWLAATEGIRSAQRGLVGRDRERPERYVMVVEFPSHEDAVANSALSDTAAFAEKLTGLCLSAPAFRDLELVRLDELEAPRSTALSTARATRCPGCGVEFRVDSEQGIEHLVAAVQEHALGSHGHEVSRDHVLSELGSTA